MKNISVLNFSDGHQAGNSASLAISGFGSRQKRRGFEEKLAGPRSKIPPDLEVWVADTSRNVLEVQLCLFILAHHLWAYLGCFR